MVFGGYQIGYVINMRDWATTFCIKGGHVTCSVNKSGIELMKEKKAYVRISTSGGNWVGKLNVYLKEPEMVMKHTNDSY